MSIGPCKDNLGKEDTKEHESFKPFTVLTNIKI